MQEDTHSGPVQSGEPLGGRKENKESWLTMPVAVVIAGVIIAGAIIATKTSVPGSAAAAAPAGAAIAAGTLRPASHDDHIIGNPDAPVVIIEFADFQCPYCSLIYPSLKKIVENSNGQVAWVFRNFPLESIHPEARPAAEAAECIAGLLGNDAYWKFMDDDFANQQNLSDAWFAAEAGKLGANMADFNSCVTSKTDDKRIDTDVAEAIQNGGNGTPFTIVVPRGGQPIPFSGALPYSQINAIVNTALAKATTTTGN